jgi:formyltetrahydrofolate-dependent phosphoribosylglycinamide formyltransferase
MFEGLQKKWKVGGWRLFLILVIFALGGSLTGYAARKLVAALGLHGPVLNIVIYVVLVTLIWPLAVIVVSLPFGQFPFFRHYLVRMVGRMSGRARAVNADSPAGHSGGSKRIIIFASGAGSNAQKIIDHFRGTAVSIVQIVGNKADAGIVSIAKREGIPFLLIEKERFFRGDAYLPELDASADLVVLAGFLWKVPATLIEAFPRRIINIHPALLPKFGGKGMYGGYVHSAVLESGDLESGITIHYVDGHYDNGDIIFQTGCPVLPGDTPEKLALRIHELEHLHYPQVIEKLLSETVNS